MSGKLSKCDFVIKAPINCGFDTLPYGWDMKKLCSRLMDEIDIFSRLCSFAKMMYGEAGSSLRQLDGSLEMSI